MSRIRGRGNQSTEMKLVTAFKDSGVRGWRRHVLLKPRAGPDKESLNKKLSRLKIKPDFVFRPQKLAVFVDGCFWHGCPLHARKPKANAEMWRRKLEGNISRDERSTQALISAGWEVVRIWEHELVDVDVVVDRVKTCLAERTLKPPFHSEHARGK